MPNIIEQIKQSEHINNNIRLVLDLALLISYPETFPAKASILLDWKYDVNEDLILVSYKMADSKSGEVYLPSSYVLDEFFTTTGCPRVESNHPMLADIDIDTLPEAARYFIK